MMKKCVNPNCESSFLFGNDKITCPFCHSRLADNVTESGFEAETILPPDRVSFGDIETGMEDTEFLRERFGTVECHGRILEIDHQELFNSKRYKLFNSLFRGEPYQFAHQTIEYTIRVENITEDFPTEVTDFCLFGNYLGRLQVGDEVVVRAKNLRNRRLVKSIYNQTTNSIVKPGFQIPAGIIRGIFLIPALVIIALICGLVWLVKSGTMEVALIAIMAVLMSVITFCVGLGLLVRSIFPRRRR